MVPDNELPVWTFRANWSDPIIERLAWLTDVLASSFGPEQRRALRLSPRREFEVKFNPIDEARSYFELFLHRLGSNEFMLPMYHDAATLTAGVAGGAGALPIDTTFREFVADGMAIIMGDDPFSCDVVEITALAADSISVTGVSKAWPKGSVVHPLRRSRLDQESAIAALTHHVGDAMMLFQLNQGNDIPAEGVWDTVFAGHPVITVEPNRRENLDLSFERYSLTLDNDHGLRELGDDAGRAFTVQVDNRMMHGRAEHWAFRQFLYRLRGQQGAIWLPTFNRDVQVSRPYTAGDPELAIKKIGYEYTGGSVSGRRFIRFTDGTVAEIDDVGAPPSVTEESLVLQDALADDLAAGLYGSFMDTCRLAGDQIEITHHTSTDGAAECNLSFRSFRDERVIPNPISSPIPFAEKTVDFCGAPAEATCVPGDLGDGSTGPATDGTGDPAWEPGPGMPGYYDYSSFLAVNLTTYGYGEDLGHSGPETGDEHIISGPTLTPADVAEFNGRFRDLMVQAPGITRPWINRDFPPLAAIDGAHTHTVTVSAEPLQNHIPNDNPTDADNLFYGVPWPINYVVSFLPDGLGGWQNTYTMSPWDDPSPWVAIAGGPYTETVEYWPTHGGGAEPQIKKVTGVGYIFTCGTDPGLSNEGVWIADSLEQLLGARNGLGQQLWYSIYYCNFVKYCPKIGLVE